MNIYIRELKANRKSIIIWSIIMIMFVIMGMQKYTSFLGENGSTAEMLKLIETMPKFLRVMWGVDTLDITTAIGYFGVMVSYLMLMSAIHASTLGTNIIYKEERDKTADFLMTKPISRSKIITSKLLAGLTNIFIFNIVTIITSIFVLKGLGANNITNPIILTTIALFLIQILFLVLGISIASIMKHPKKAGMITLFLILGTYFLSIIIGLSDKISFLKVLTPYEYFSAKEYMATNNLNVGYIILVVIIISVLLYETYKRYKKRDLII